MNPSYRHVYAHHRVLFTLPLVLTTVLAVWYVLGAPKLYKSSASLWVDTPVSQPSYLSNPAGFAVTPSAQAQQLLEEFLTTRAFRLEVARRGPLARYVATTPPSGFGPSELLAKLKGKESLTDRMLNALGPKMVLTTQSGPQVLGISVESTSPSVAVGTLSALIEQFSSQLRALTLSRASATVAYNLKVAAAGAQTLALAKKQVSTFELANPFATTRSSGTTPQDVELRGLVAAQNIAAARYTTAKLAASEASANLASTLTAGTSFQVLDRPGTATSASSHKKDLMAVVGGVFVGALISFLCVVAASGSPVPAPETEGVLRGPEHQANGTVAPRELPALSADIAASGIPSPGNATSSG